MLTHFTNTIMPAVQVLMEMGAGGIRVDPVEGERWRRLLQRKLDKLERLWYRHYAPVNPYSYKQLNDLVYKKWKLPVQRTKADGVTLDELAALNLREIVRTGKGAKVRPWEEHCEVTPRTFDLLIAIRGVSKLLKTYSKVKVSDNGYIYPQYLPESKDAETLDGKKRKGAAATGRLASRDPNIQNQPKRARRLFIPDYEHFSFIQWDYSAAELWVMAAMSGDPVMLDDLRSGDAHQRGADDIGCERQTYKAVAYGTMYGAGAAKISETVFLQDQIVIPVPECKRVQNGLARRWHVMWAYRQHIADMCINDGYIANAFTRTRFFYGGSSDVPSALDYIPQSTVADILWSVLVEVNRIVKKYGGRLTTTVHDSILAQVPDEHLDAVDVEVRAVMEQVWNQVAPDFHLTVDTEIGKNWGRMKKVKRG